MKKVGVVFNIDANGILSVKAKDKTSGKEQSVRIEGSSGLSKEEIERMKTDAAAHAEEDKKKRENAETRNLAEALIFTAEKSLKDARDKVSAELKTSIETKITALRAVKDRGNKEEIKKASEELSTEIQKISAEMSKPGPDTTAPGPDTPPNPDSQPNT